MLRRIGIFAALLSYKIDDNLNFSLSVLIFLEFHPKHEMPPKVDLDT